MSTPGRPFPLFLLALALLLGGGLLSAVAGTGTYLPRLLLVSGLAAAVWGIVRLWPTLVVLFVRMRQVAEPGPALTWFLLGLILLVCAVGLGVRRARYDLTARGRQSLSVTSREALAQVHRPIHLVGVFAEGTPERERARDALQIYRTTCRELTSELIDPERQPEIARRYGIHFNNGILVLADSVREVVNEITEEGITQAILRVCDPRRPVVAILEGHGETDPRRSTLTRLRENIARDGFKWRFLRLGEYADVPEDVRAVLILGPTAPLLPGEIAALGRFLDRGGRLGILLDPGSSTSLEKLLEDRGIEVDGRPVGDDGSLTSSVGLGRETVAVQSLGDHDITRGLASAIILPGATRVGFRPGPAMESIEVVLLKSAPTARLIGARRDSTGASADAAEPSGPLPLGVAVQWEVPPRNVPGATRVGATSEKPYARIVVVGDSDFLRDTGIDLYGNRAFTNRMLGWLGEREFLLRFPITDRSGTPLKVSLAGLRAIFYLVEVLLPLLFLGLGVYTWVRRR